MKTLRGDIVECAKEGTFDIIVHGCNCFCTMGSGVAKQLREEFPEIAEMDYRTKVGNYNKLGTYSHWLLPNNTTIINGYTQFKYGMDRRYADYDAIARVFALIKQNYSSKTIAYPLIGAGLAGGSWDIIEKIIDVELEGEEHTLIVLL